MEEPAQRHEQYVLVAKLVSQATKEGVQTTQSFPLLCTVRELMTFGIVFRNRSTWMRVLNRYAEFECVCRI
jgi:hypothetical protein